MKTVRIFEGDFIGLGFNRLACWAIEASGGIIEADC
jgi:hypothetical protein